MSATTGVMQSALANQTAAQGLSGAAQGNAAGLYGSLAPQLQQEAAAPQGINATDLASMNTAAQQSAGGSNAGAVGQGSLLSARTRNAGTADSAVAKSAENAGQNLGNEAVGTQNENTQAKFKQQQEGLQGMQGLYGTSESAALGGLNAANSANTTAAKAPLPWWEGALNRSVQTPWGGVGQISGVGG